MNTVRSNTLVDRPRLDKILEVLELTATLAGEVAEVGVYKGGTAKLICDNTSKRVLLFDTFEGMPKVNPMLDIHKQGDFADTSMDHVTKVLGISNNYALYKGVFPRENWEYAAHLRFSFVHLDVDIYDSVKECLEFFYPKMSSGGIILLDDYNEPNCPGAKLAADEFVRLHHIGVVPTVQSQALIQVP